MRKLLALLLLLSVLLIVNGCGGVGGNAGLIRYLHAASDLGGIDILINNSAAVTDLRYKSSSDYTGVGNGQTVIKVRRTGTSAILVQRSVSVSANQELTVILVGKASPGAGEPALAIRVFNDDRSQADQNAFEVRCINASAENGPADVYLVNSNQDQNSGGVNPLFANLDFGTTSSYVQLPASSKRVILTQSGNSATEFYDSGSGDLVSFEERSKKTLVLVDGNIPGVMDRPVVLLDRAGGGIGLKPKK